MVHACVSGTGQQAEQYRTECNYRRECIFVAVVTTVGNNISRLCNYGNYGGNYGFWKIIIFATIITFGTVRNRHCISWTIRVLVGSTMLLHWKGMARCTSTVTECCLSLLDQLQKNIGNRMLFKLTQSTAEEKLIRFGDLLHLVACILPSPAATTFADSNLLLGRLGTDFDT